MTSSEWNGRIDPAIKTFIFKDGSDPDIMRAYKYYSEVYKFSNPWKLHGANRTLLLLRIPISKGNF